MIWIAFCLRVLLTKNQVGRVQWGWAVMAVEFYERVAVIHVSCDHAFSGSGPLNPRQMQRCLHALKHSNHNNLIIRILRKTYIKWCMLQKFPQLNAYIYFKYKTNWSSPCQKSYLGLLLAICSSSCIQVKIIVN